MRSKDIFSPEMQEKFWSSVDPEAIELLQMFEKRENWTHKYNELPDFYQEMADLIPEIQEFSENKNPTEELQNRLIKLLACMSLKNNVAAMVWLDNKLQSEMSKGSSVIIYNQCENLVSGKGDQDKELQKCARVLIDRIQLMVRLKLLVTIFSEGGETNA